MSGYSFLKKPNLPDGKVVHAVVTAQYPQIVLELEKSGVVPVTVTSCENVLFPLRNHADMLFTYLGNGVFAAEESQNELINQLKSLNADCVCDSIRLKPVYPSDILLNCCIIGESIICKSDVTPDFLKNGRRVIDVKQGYAKCSCVPVDENSLITDDPSIHIAAVASGIDALLVRKGSIMLEGFDTGFIGGCCGKLTKDVLAFCGDVKKHADYELINSFLRERSVYPFSLSGGDLTDIGSIIPVTNVLTAP